MSATVTDLSAFAARVMRRPLSAEQEARERVRMQLRATACGPQRIEQACSRAARLVAANYPIDKAARRAIAWATCADDGRDPPPLAA